jgi:hypothetical protein
MLSLLRGSRERTYTRFCLSPRLRHTHVEIVVTGHAICGRSHPDRISTLSVDLIDLLFIVIDAVTQVDLALR